MLCFALLCKAKGKNCSLKSNQRFIQVLVGAAQDKSVLDKKNELNLQVPLLCPHQRSKQPCFPAKRRVFIWGCLLRWLATPEARGDKLFCRRGVAYFLFIFGDISSPLLSCSLLGINEKGCFSPKGRAIRSPPLCSPVEQKGRALISLRSAHPLRVACFPCASDPFPLLCPAPLLCLLPCFARQSKGPLSPSG